MGNETEIVIRRQQSSPFSFNMNTTLIIISKALGHRVMNDIPNIWFINTHAESYSRTHDLVILVQA
jgi:hypothetical protein